MKNGYTLIELLGVIVIISVLALITVPIIDSSLNKGKQNLSDVQEKQIIKGLKDYYSAKLNELSNLSGEACKTVKDIQDAGFLPSEIKDPKSNTTYDVSNKEVCVRKTSTTCLSHLDNDCYNYDYYLK